MEFFSEIFNLFNFFQEKGEAKAKEYKASFLETSAKTNTEIDKAFTMLTKVILDKTIKAVEVPDLKLQLTYKPKQCGLTKSVFVFIKQCLCLH